MNIIAVDDERLALRALKDELTKLYPSSYTKCFSSPREALEYAQSTQVDVAFLDIEMGGMSGLLLAKGLKEAHARTNIIFVTGHSQYALSAFDLTPSGYLLKPITAEAILKEMDDLRYPLSREDKRVRIQTFGNFEVFVDGEPLVISRNRAKELLAYIVDRRGALVTRRELATVLWEGKEYNRAAQGYLQVLISSLIKALRKKNVEDILIHKNAAYAIDEKKVDCDFYRFIRGDASAVNNYNGEYMANYSWAMFTEGMLTEKIRRELDEK